MSNTPEERQKFKMCLGKIVRKYGDWVEDSRHLYNLLGSTEAEFDEMIQFLSPPDFQVVLMQRRFQASAGCSVAALTTSRLDDDKPSDFQRRIYFRRGVDVEHSIVHELFHFLTHPRFYAELKTETVEGFTEYFTLKILKPSEASVEHPLAAAAAAASAASAADPPAPIEEEKPISAYGDLTRKANQTRAFIKGSYLPAVRDVRHFSTKPNRGGHGGLIGRQRDKRFIPDDTKGINFNDFTKRAFFKGDPEMIRLIKEQS